MRRIVSGLFIVVLTISAAYFFYHYGNLVSNTRHTDPFTNEIDSEIESIPAFHPTADSQAELEKLQEIVENFDKSKSYGDLIDITTNKIVSFADLTPDQKFAYMYSQQIYAAMALNVLRIKTDEEISQYRQKLLQADLSKEDADSILESKKKSEDRAKEILKARMKLAMKSELFLERAIKYYVQNNKDLADELKQCLEDSKRYNDAHQLVDRNPKKEKSSK